MAGFLLVYVFFFLKTETVRVRVTAGISSQEILWCAHSLRVSPSPPFKFIFNFDLIFILSLDPNPPLLPSTPPPFPIHTISQLDAAGPPGGSLQEVRVTMKGVLR